ncbi:hypothetical protein [Pengzhenrongella sp.]|uniref:hypothetical protein n=1 Tax=Pengzhenrongella sp. TaxID=2888820 RepID=UPI002F92CC7D
MINRLRARRRLGGDAGFSLIEAVVALLIAGVIFGALATTLIVSVQASLFGRQNQQATDFMTREVENLRALNFGSLSNVATDVAGDTRLVSSGCGAPKCLSVDGVLEPVLTATAGGVNPHTTVLNNAETNLTAFTVSRYITQMADQPVGQARRATVYVTWQSKGVLKTRSMSTAIAYTQRGLPLPVFKLDLPVATHTVNQSGSLDYTLTLTNQGATDRWNLALTGATTGWSLYGDTVPADGYLDTSIDHPLTDTTGDGIVDTGRIDPSTTFRFFLTHLTSPTEALGTTVRTVTATSVGQPTASGAAKSVVATAIVTSGAVIPPPPPPPVVPPVTTETTCAAATVETPNAMRAGYTQQQYVVHNDGVGDTTLQPQMYFNSVAGDEPILAHFSTDVSATATGRVMAPTGAAAPTAAAVIALTGGQKYADWALQYGAKVKADGTGVLHLWAARSGGTGATVPIKVVLYSATGSATGLTRTVLAEKDATLGTLTCAGFQEFYVKLPDVVDKQIVKNGWLGVRVVTWGADSVRLGYDVATQFPATFTIGIK